VFCGSVHAEKLSCGVLQSVVDLLWSQLDSMSSAVIGSATPLVGQQSDGLVTTGSDDATNDLSADTHVQCTLHTHILESCTYGPADATVTHCLVLQ